MMTMMNDASAGVTAMCEGMIAFGAGLMGLAQGPGWIGALTLAGVAMLAGHALAARRSGANEAPADLGLKR